MVEMTHRLKARATAVSLCESSVRTYTHFYDIKLFNENERVRKGRSWEEGAEVRGRRARLAFGWH